ncbi:hypothetical protein NPX13_g9209 [Xylaria arbuscula]|uniref:Glycoside hydrolase family 49 N-terminal domain-containing protein n=1 Tax=Xylaria arbuscula TaxID=114810 RepID=A0A9W8N703_9PEZI|nr:hypothetical protein NPX13_g9209 [Xylaria arbuscula]
MSLWRLVAYICLYHGSEVTARPNRRQAPGSSSMPITPVTSTTSIDGQLITATYTPTSISIMGLVPPITAATTVTTTDETGATIAVAVGVGAGVVAGGALAGWLFKPIPGMPPAPTMPPPYMTSAQDEPPQSMTTSIQSTTTSEPPSCPFPSQGSKLQFSPAAQQPVWTAEIPSQTGSSYYPQCTSSENGVLARGVDPGFIQELSAVFCKTDQSKDETQTIGKDDLPDDSSWKRDDGPEEEIMFKFDFKNNADGCTDHCQDAYSELITGCKYNSHYLYGSGTLEQGCGNYSLVVGGEPRTELKCTGAQDDPLSNYIYRDAALDAIENFCKAQDGKVVNEGDQASFIQENIFSISYADSCGGSGSYTVKHDICVKYLNTALDSCDTDTIVYKHGGTVQDTDNCGLFELHPKGFDLVACYPENEEKNYIPNTREHLTVTQEMAQDAVNTFCDRSGDGQQYTLDPNYARNTGFIQDVCKEKGYAECNYLYRNDGTMVTGNESADVVIRFEVLHYDFGDQFACSTPQVYEIHGDRCKHMLGKLIGTESITQCVEDTSKLDLGTFVESGDKGHRCILQSHETAMFSPLGFDVPIALVGNTGFQDPCAKVLGKLTEAMPFYHDISKTANLFWGFGELGCVSPRSSASYLWIGSNDSPAMALRCLSLFIAASPLMSAVVADVTAPGNETADIDSLTTWWHETGEINYETPVQPGNVRQSHVYSAWVKSTTDADETYYNSFVYETIPRNGQGNIVIPGDPTSVTTEDDGVTVEEAVWITMAWTQFLYASDAWVKISRRGSTTNVTAADVTIRPDNLGVQVADDGANNIYILVPYSDAGLRFSVEFNDNLYTYRDSCATPVCDFVQNWNPDGAYYVSEFTDDNAVMGTEPHDALLIFASPRSTADPVPDASALETYVVYPGDVPVSELTSATNTNLYFMPGVHEMSATQHLILSSTFNWVYLSPGSYIKGAIEFTTSSASIRATGMGVLSGEKYVYQANTAENYTNVKSNGDSLRIWSGHSAAGVEQTFTLTGVTTNAPPFNSIDFEGDLDSIKIVQEDYKQVGAFFGQTDGTTLYSGARVSGVFYHSGDDTIKTYGSDITVRDIVSDSGEL